MRTRRWVVLVMLLTVAPIGHLLADQNRPAENPGIDELRAPASPAFVLLDVSPTAVERPNTPRALALSLLSASAQNDSSFPQDVAVEFAPYWWKSRPGMTFKDYYDPKKGLKKTVLQTFAVSIATADLENVSGVKGSRAALGVRFMLRHGRAAPQLPEKVKALKDLQLDLLTTCVPDVRTKEVDPKCEGRFEAKLRAAGREVAKLDKERQGLLVEFASAVVADFPDDNADDADVTKLGAWVTVSYSRGKQLTFLGVGRHIREDIGAETLGKSDVGLRLIWKGDVETMPPVSLSIEYVRRFVSGTPDTDRLAAVLEYPLPGENTALIASYGKAFENDLTGEQKIVATFGVKFGFGEGPVAH